MLLLTDAPRRLRVSMSPKDSVTEGKDAVLTCESDANPPISQYAWFDWNNQNLHHYDRMLRLDPVKVEHSGAYWCQGTNRLGVGQSPPSTLTVYCKALFLCFFGLGHSCVFRPRLCVPDHLPLLPYPLLPCPARPAQLVCSEAQPCSTTQLACLPSSSPSLP